MSPWLLLHLVVALIGAVGGFFLATKGPVAVSGWFVLISSVGGFLFTWMAVYLSLWRRYEAAGDKSVIDGKLWELPLTNPQGNRLAQAIFFGSIGLSAILQARNGMSQSMGFFPLAMGCGIMSALLVFRWKYRVA